MAKGRRKSAKRPSQRTGAAARPRPARARGVAADATDELTEAQLKRALADAHDEQAATSEVLKLISASPGDLRPVFEAILENATRICEAEFGNLYLYEGGAFRAGCDA